MPGRNFFKCVFVLATFYEPLVEVLDYDLPDGMPEYLYEDTNFLSIPEFSTLQLNNFLQIPTFDIFDNPDSCMGLAGKITNISSYYYSIDEDSFYDQFPKNESGEYAYYLFS